MSLFDNRTHPVFKGTTATNTVNLGLTTKCSMRCPNCSLGMVRDLEDGSAKHAHVEEIVRDSCLMRPMRRVHLTGGEPTIHPQFALIAAAARTWFNAEYVTLETNGTHYKKHRETIYDCFDLVFITHYVKNKIYPGNFDNTEIIELAQKDLGDRLIREEPVVHASAHRLTPRAGVHGACTKWHSPGLASGWYDGRLYACCVSYGIDRSLGIPVTPDWREKIALMAANAEMGCNRCVYGGT